MTDWDGRWMKVARTYASFSKDPSTRVGAVIVKDNRVISAGWNGFPRGVVDTTERLNDREQKYRLTVHAEMNAILNAAYHGASLAGTTLYVTGLPCCSDCAKAIVQSGVVEVVMEYPCEVSEKWAESAELTRQMFSEAGIKYSKRISYRDESGDAVAS